MSIMAEIYRKCRNCVAPSNGCCMSCIQAIFSEITSRNSEFRLSAIAVGPTANLHLKIRPPVRLSTEKSCRHLETDQRWDVLAVHGQLVDAVSPQQRLRVSKMITEGVTGVGVTADGEQRATCR